MLNNLVNDQHPPRPLPFPTMDPIRAQDVSVGGHANDDQPPRRSARVAGQRQGQRQNDPEEHAERSKSQQGGQLQARTSKLQSQETLTVVNTGAAPAALDRLEPNQTAFIQQRNLPRTQHNVCTPKVH